MDKPESKESINDDQLKVILWQIRNGAKGVHDLYRELVAKVTSVPIVLNEKNWRVVVTIDQNRLNVSFDYLSKLSRTELFVLK